MKLFPKILQFLKKSGYVIGGVSAIGGAVLFFDGIRDNINSNFDSMKSDVIDSLSGFRDVIINYQIETNKGMQSKTGQINEILEQLKTLDRNQKIIILKSNESQQILEEIKNQQLIDGAVDIGIIESRDAFVVQLKKKESELLE